MKTMQRAILSRICRLNCVFCAPPNNNNAVNLLSGMSHNRLNEGIGGMTSFYADNLKPCKVISIETDDLSEKNKKITRIPINPKGISGEFYAKEF